MAGTRSLSIEFAVTPRFDVFYALYALTSTATTTLSQWREKARGRLPRDFNRAAGRIAPLPIFWPLLADAMQNAPGEITFEEMLSALIATSPRDVQRNILAGIFHDRGFVDTLIEGKMSLSQAVGRDDSPGADLLGHFGLRPYRQTSPAVKAMNSLLSRPESFRETMSQVVRDFWETGFKHDWSVLEPQLRAEAFRMSDLREDMSTPSLGRELALPVTFDDAAKEVRPKVGPMIEYDRVDRCYVIPSAFNVRKWWAKYETKPGHLTLYFPVVRDAGLANESVKDELRVVEPAVDRRPDPKSESVTATKRRLEVNAESVFRALGDTTRYAIASILARTPKTSAELARSLNVSKPTITHHVQALRSAGLLSETPAGGSTKLSLREDTVAALSGAALEQLFASTGDLSLTTTRKRRNS